MSKAEEQIVKTYSARLSSKGQVVLPKDLRETFQLDYGDIIDFEVIKKATRKKEIRLKKAPTVFELAGTLKPKKGTKPLKSEKMRRYIEKNYDRA